MVKEIKFKLILLALIALTSCNMNKNSFDAEKWKQLSSTKKADLEWKAAMIPILLNTELSQGMTEEAVKSTLGEADYIKNNLWYYNLGLAGYGIDEEFLKLIFDDSGHLDQFFLSRL